MNPLLKPFIAIFLAISFGLLFPQLAFLAPYAIYFLGVLLVASMIDINFYHLKDAFHHQKKFALLLLTNYALLPLLAFALAHLFIETPSLFAGLVLMGMVPMAVGTIYWTKLLKADLSFGVSSTVVSHLLAPILLPLLTFFLLRETITINIIDFFFDILAIIFIPLLMVFFLQKVPQVQKNIEKVEIPAIFAIVLSLTASNSDKLLDITTWNLALPVFLLCAGCMLIPILITFKWSRELRVPVVIGLLLRNAVLAMTLAAMYFGAEAALPGLFNAIICNIFLALFVYLYKKGII